MKLATYNDGSRDGQLVVVSRDLSQAHYASHIANRMQQVLDDWNFISPQLQDLYDALNAGRARHAFAFDPAQCMAPLPRAHAWICAKAYRTHAELVYPEKVAALPDHHALMHYASGAALGGPASPMVCADEAWGLDFEAQIAVITGDVPAASTADRALESVRLVLLANAVCVRSAPDRLADAVHPQVIAAFSPVAITPDELGDAWSRGRVQLPLQVSWNGRKVGMCEAGQDMGLHFGQLLAQASRLHGVPAGSVLGCGAVTNAGVEKKGRTDWPMGYSSIADKRAMETRQDGQPTTPFLKLGDVVRVEMKGRDGKSLFGAIEHTVVAPPSGRP